MIELDLGYCPDSSRVTAEIEKHEQAGALIVAPTNRGKSFLVDRTVGNAMALNDELLVYLFDPKGGVDFTRCKLFNEFSILDTNDSANECLEAVRSIHKYMDEAAKFRKLVGTKDSIYRLRRKNIPGSEKYRPRIIILDEWWRIIHHSKPKSAKDYTPYDLLMEELKGLAEKILREGRSYGVFILCISQSPRAEEIKINGAEDSFAWIIFGQALEQMAISLRLPQLATDPDLKNPGYFYFKSGSDIRKFRVPSI